MRIVAGEHKGRRLVAPPERITRPTTDRVRESLMSALVSARGGLQDAMVLDLFAGSGALSFESLSRGATFACLFDSDKQAILAMKKNAEILGYAPDQARIVRADSFKSIPPRKGFDIVFVDPPYIVNPKDVFDLLGSLVAGGIVVAGALVVYEHDINVDIEEYLTQNAYRLVSHKSHSSSAYDILEVI